MRNCRVDALFVEALAGGHAGATEGAACCPSALTLGFGRGCQPAAPSACAWGTCLPGGFAVIEHTTAVHGCCPVVRMGAAKPNQNPSPNKLGGIIQI